MLFYPTSSDFGVFRGRIAVTHELRCGYKFIDVFR